MNSLTTVGGTVVDAEAMEAREPKRDLRRPTSARRGPSVDRYPPAPLPYRPSVPPKSQSHDAAPDDEAALPLTRSFSSRRAIPRPKLEARDPSYGSVEARRHHPRFVSETRDRAASVSGSVGEARNEVPVRAEERGEAPSMPSQGGQGNRSIIEALQKLAQSERYASSSHFQRMFEQGIQGVEAHDGELRDVEQAVSLCFGVKEDMASLIAAEAERMLAVEATADAPAVTSHGEEAYNEMPDEALEVGVARGERAARPARPWEAAMNRWVEEQPARHTKPWEEPSTDNYYGGAVRRSGRALGQALSASRPMPPTDLSGYKTPGSNPSHALSLPLPPTPGKNQSEYEATTPRTARSRVSSVQALSTPATPGKLQDSYEELDLSGHLYLPTTSQSASPDNSVGPPAADQYITRTIQEDLAETERKEQARLRVQHYLERIDDRIRTVREGHSPGARPANVRRMQSGIGAARAARDTARVEQVQRWGAFAGANEEMKRRLVVPTLQTPGWEDQGGQEKVGLTRDQARIGEAPFDESDGRLGASGPAALRSSSSEERVKAVESAVGLKSLQEYKRLLEEKTLEMEGLEHRYKTHVEESEQGIEKRDEEIGRFKVAMKEAERALSALEQTIAQLEVAAEQKDELIDRLQAKVEVLEEELGKSGKSNLEREAEYQEQVRALNESIAQLNKAANEKDESIVTLENKTEGLERELSKTLEQYDESQAELKDVQFVMARKDDQIAAKEEELKSTKDMLQGQMELYKNEIATSLENTTQLMDLMSQEKDGLIESLHAKIAMLEQSLAEVEEEKEGEATKHDEKEKELNDKIHTLALALTEKDRQIDDIQKEMKKNKEAFTKTPKAGTARRKGRRKGERESDYSLSPRPRHHHRHGKHRQHHRMISPEGYYRPPRERGYYDEDSRDDEMRHHGGHRMVYYSTSGDSIFDFSS